MLRRAAFAPAILLLLVTPVSAHDDRHGVATPPPGASVGAGAVARCGEPADDAPGSDTPEAECPARRFAADPAERTRHSAAADGEPPLAPAPHGPLSSESGPGPLDGDAFVSGETGREVTERLTLPRTDRPLAGSVGFAFAPSAWAADGPSLGRAGHGGFTRAGAPAEYGLSFSVAGSARRGTLDFAAGYAPEWTRRSWILDRDGTNRQRDGVDPAALGGSGNFATLRTDRYRIGLAWRPTARQVIRAGVWGSPASSRGVLRSGAQRIAASADPGILAAPSPGGAPDTAAAAGVTGDMHARENGGAVEWRWSGRRWRFAAVHARRVESGGERFATGAAAASYNDIRRSQVYAMQSFFGAPHVTSPAQYRFGGLGLYDAEESLRVRDTRLEAGYDFALGGEHSLSLSAERESRELLENRGRSGPQGAAGPRVALRFAYGRPIRSSEVYLRRGYTAQALCGAIDPYGADFLAACPAVTYQINRAQISPLQAATEIHGERVALRDVWVRGRWTFDGAVRHDRVRIFDPDRYELRSDVTGEVLTGADGWPVGSRDEDVLIDPYNPQRPRYLGAPGEFLAGEYRFPGEWSYRLAARWDPRGDGGLIVRAAVDSSADPLADDLAEHAFENGFGVASIQFTSPDLSTQLGSAVTYGGGGNRVAAGTRLGRSEHLAVAVNGAAGRATWGAELRLGRMRRFLTHTQANWAEAVMNRTYDGYVLNDALFGTRYCMNCALGQVSLFPAFPSLYVNGSPTTINPDARFLLAETLANPGENTAPGRFPRPTRRETSLRATLDLPLDADQRYSLHAGIALTRLRGNNAGNFELGSGLDHPELTSQYAYPRSPLTESAYREGDLEGAYGVDTPPSAAAELVLSAARLGSGWSADLRGRWERGRPRTPLLALPGTQIDGTLPGDSPDYYIMDLNLDGIPDRMILRGARAVPRGGYGRTPDRASLDARAVWRHAFAAGSLELSLEVDNLFNRTAAVRYDDQQERRVGFLAPGADGRLTDPRIPAHEEPATDPTLRSANPSAGDPLLAESGRRGRLGVTWSF